MSRTKTTSRGKRRVKRRIVFPSVEEWKRRTGFQPRRKIRSVSLCVLFENEKKRNPKKNIYTPRII